MASSKKIGTELQSIKEPQKVKVLILTENKLQAKDFYLIKNFTQVIKIDLSYNKIGSFPAGFGFKQFIYLKTLFLHYNKFTSIKHLLPVTECQHIQYLTLFGNPLEEGKARHFFINQIPSIILMDDKIVKLEERNPDFNLKDSQISDLSFPLVPQGNHDTSKLYIETLIQQLAIARKAYLIGNPLIHIQRWWKNHLNRRHKHANIDLTPSTQLIKRQSTLKSYKNDLDRLVTEKMVTPNSEELIISLIRANYEFWQFMKQIVNESKIYFSLEYCQLKAIPFEYIQTNIFIRNCQNADANTIRSKRGLLFFQYLHNKIITSKKLKINKKQLSIKASQKFRLNRNKFIKCQQRIAKREIQYNYYVTPLIQKEQLFKIISSKQEKCTFPILIEKLITRSKAAVNIQRIWRGYKVRKSVDAYLQIKQKESAIKIQRWIRKLKFIHRHKFLLQVSHYLKKQKTNQITLQMRQIEAIQLYCTYKQNYGSNLLIPFQQCHFEIKGNSQKALKIIFYAQRKPYPGYIDLSIITQSRKNIQQIKIKSSILQILFQQAKNVFSITDSKGIKYVKFLYESIEEAQNRKFILALKTYRMIKHQFIRSKQIPNTPKQDSFFKQIIENKLISITYDSNNNHKQGTVQHIFKNLQNSKSQSSLNSDIIFIDDVICIKIKLFIVTNDLSCALFIKTPSLKFNYPKFSISSNARHIYLGRKSSRRYAEEQGSELVSKISRNVMSLDDFEPQPSIRKASQRRESAVYQKNLNTDQSHSIIWPMSPKNSLNKFQAFRKMQSFDKFDKQVYPDVSVGESIHQKFNSHTQCLLLKKEKIEQIKSAHRRNIAYLSSQKEENLNKLRKSIQKQSLQAIKKIQQAKSMLQQKKIMKHDKIKHHFKSSPNNFEKDFLKKGMQSIKKQFRQYEKHISFRQSIQPNLQKKAKINSLKTEIRQFQIDLNEQAQTYKQNNSKNKPYMCSLLKKSIDNYDSLQSSQQLQKQQSIENISVQESELKQPINKAVDQERRQLRKKRVVHSVFPQQFYPLKQSNMIGFELPKIAKR